MDSTCQAVLTNQMRAGGGCPHGADSCVELCSLVGTRLETTGLREVTPAGRTSAPQRQLDRDVLLVGSEDCKSIEGKTTDRLFS